MSLELVRESARVIRVAGEDLAEKIVEHDIIVPDVSRVLILDGEVLEKSAQATQDKILVDGSIRYKILYISNEPDQEVKSIITATDFSHGIDVKNARAGMKPTVRYDIDHMEYKILNGRIINVRTILKLYGRVYEDSVQDIVNDIRGVDDIQILMDSVDISCYLGENTVNHVANEMLEIPAGKPSIREILRNDVKITGKDYRIADNKIIVKGNIDVLTLYVGDNEERSIEFMEHEMPFTQHIELDGIGENTVCEVDYRVLNYSFNPMNDSDGEPRVLNGEVELSIKAQATELRNVNLVSDAYSLSTDIRIETQPFTTNKILDVEKSQIVLKETVTVDGSNPDISEIFNVLIKPLPSEVRVMDGLVSIEGNVLYDILYVANNTEQPVHCCSSELPLRHDFEIKDIKSDMRCEVDLEVEHCNYSMVSSNEVELRIVLNAYARVFDKVETSLITKISVNPDEEKKNTDYPSITIYFSQPGDTVWKIAKKYSTTVDDIRKINDISTDQEIVPGMQVIIPRKVS